MSKYIENIAIVLKNRDVQIIINIKKTLFYDWFLKVLRSLYKCNFKHSIDIPWHSIDEIQWPFRNISTSMFSSYFLFPKKSELTFDTSCIGIILCIMLTFSFYGVNEPT